MILIYTDGACLGNPGPGGWGFVALTHDERVFEDGGHSEMTTNNRMEISAVLESLIWIRSFATPPTEIEVRSDSQYVLKGIDWRHGWKHRGWISSTGQPVANRDLWERLDRVILEISPYAKLIWTYVRGHVGLPGNERADTIATNFAKDSSYHPSLYRGSYAEYGFDLRQKMLPETGAKRSSAGKKDPQHKAYYLSLVEGKLERHDSWQACWAAVMGISGARYKKISSEQEAHETLTKWGMSSHLQQPSKL